MKGSIYVAARLTEAPAPKRNHEAQTSERTMNPGWAASPELTDNRD
jgi:hypothetical protein